MRPRKVRLRSRVLIEYTVRYGSLLLCCTLATALLCGWLLRQYKEQVTASTARSLEIAVQALEKLAARQGEMAREIYLNALSSPEAMAEGELEAKRGIEQLDTFRDALLLNDCVVAFYGTDSYFTNAGRTSAETFEGRTLNLDEQSRARLADRLEKRGEAGCILLRDRSGQGVLMYLYPAPNVYAEDRKVIGYVVREKTMAEYLRSVLPEACCALAVTQDGQTAVRMPREGMPAEKAGALFERLRADGDAPGMGYVPFEYPLPYGMRLYVALDEGYLLADFLLVSRVANGVLIGLALAMAGLLFVLNLGAVRPIQDLSELVRTHAGDAPAGDSRSELLIMREMISHAYVEQDARENRQREANVEMAAQLSRLLLGGFTGREGTVRDFIHSIRPAMKDGAYAVVALACRSGEEAARLYQKMCAREDMICRREQAGEYDAVLLIVGLADPDAQCAQREKICRELLEQAQEVRAVAAAGRAYPRLREIHRSGDETTAILKGRPGAPEGSVLLFERVIRDGGSYVIPANTQSAIQAGVRADDEKATAAACREALEGIRALEGELAKAYAGYLLVQQVTELLREQRFPQRQIAALNAVTGRESSAFEREFLEALGKAFEAAKPEKQPVDEILACIDANYCDNELSLDSLGTQFHMTASNVSKMIKAKTGMNYNDYLSGLRMEQARRLLEITDLKLQEIVLRVGYVDAASFSRKFKALEGESPNEYRVRRREGRI